MKKIILISVLSLGLSGCLKTRSEVSEQDQSYLYNKKNISNQMESQSENVAATHTVVDEKDELIRSLNGRVEVLENQLAALNASKETANLQETQKMTLLQEALTKMEAQIHNLETELYGPPVANNANANSLNNPLKSSDELEKENSKENYRGKLKEVQGSKQTAAEQSVKKTDKITSEKHNSEKVISSKKNKKLGSFETAEQYLNEQDWKKAIINFQKYTEESPRGKNVAEAKYKIGLCFQELGMKEEAMAFYEEVVANYGDTAAGKKSKTRLRSFKK